MPLPYLRWSDDGVGAKGSDIASITDGFYPIPESQDAVQIPAADPAGGCKMGSRNMRDLMMIIIIMPILNLHNHTPVPIVLCGDDLRKNGLGELGVAEPRRPATF